MTQLEAKKLVAMLMGAFPGGKMQEETPAIYERMLADLDFASAQTAVARLLGTRRFLPTIAEVREVANEVARGPMRSAEEAWGDVVLAVRNVGSYRVPTFEDPLVTYAVGCLGWRNLCLEGTNDAADRARFCELYQRAAERQRQDEVSGIPLPARHAPLLPRGGMAPAIGPRKQVGRV